MSVDPIHPAGLDIVFEVSAETVGPHASWLRAVGELNLAGAEQVGALLEQCCESGHRFARLDLSEVTYLEQAALSVLLAAHHRFLAASGTLVLTGVGPRIQRLLARSGLDGTPFTIVRATDRSPNQSQSRNLANRTRRTLASRAVIHQAVRTRPEPRGPQTDPDLITA